MNDLEEAFDIVDKICSADGDFGIVKIIVLSLFTLLWFGDKFITWFPILKNKNKTDTVKENIHAVRYGASEIIAYKKQVIKNLESKLEEKERVLNQYENALIKTYHSLVYSCYSLDAIQNHIYKILIENPESHKIEVPQNILLSQSDINQQVQSLLASLKSEHDFND